MLKITAITTIRYFEEVISDTFKTGSRKYAQILFMHRNSSPNCVTVNLILMFIIVV